MKQLPTVRTPSGTIMEGNILHLSPEEIHAAERARLEQEVIRAAKESRAALKAVNEYLYGEHREGRKVPDHDPEVRRLMLEEADAYHRLDAAVDALSEFESQKPAGE